MSLKDQIAADTESVFLDADDGFAYTATHRIKGDANDTETVTLIVDWDMTQETKGGANLNQDRGGQRANQDVWVDMLESVVVHEEKCQFVLEDGTVLNFVKIVGRDIEGGMKTGLCRAPRGITSKQTRVR